MPTHAEPSDVALGLMDRHTVLRLPASCGAFHESRHEGRAQGIALHLQATDRFERRARHNACMLGQLDEVTDVEDKVLRVTATPFLQNSSCAGTSIDRGGLAANVALAISV